MLKVSRLSRFYGEYKAVNEVNFEINRKEIVGLLGHNGAGKTTIMKMLSGYLEPDSGRINIDGLDIADSAKQIQKTLGYLPENLPIYPEMSVADYLDYAADLKGLANDFKRSEMRRVVKETEIGEKLLQPIATLSRGFKQRVGVAQALLGKPKLLIMDEPTNGLDPVQTQHMRNLIREIAKKATVIISTHIMQEVEAICDRVLIVKNGNLEIDEKLETLKIARQLDVGTDISGKAFAELLENIDSVQSCRELSDSAKSASNLYRVDLKEKASVADTANELARKLVTCDAAIYQIQPVTRNLEKLFRDVNDLEKDTQDTKEGMGHAA